MSWGYLGEAERQIPSGFSHMGESRHKKCFWPATDRGWLLCLERRRSVWEIRLLEGCGRAQVSASWLIFPVVDQSGGGVMGSCDEKHSCYLSHYQEMSGSENKHHQKSEVQKAWTTHGNQSAWLLPQVTPANVDFSPSLQWSIWCAFKMQKTSGTLWSHTVFAAHVADCEERHLG